MRYISRKRSTETLDKTLADAAGFHMNSSPFAPPALSTRKNVYLLIQLKRCPSTISKIPPSNSVRRFRTTKTNLSPPPSPW